MPTERARYMLTETDAVQAALTRARKRWPEDRDRPTRLLLRLVDAGDQVLREDEQDRIAERRRALEEMSGQFAGVYPPGYLKELREDWPE